jgi:hypothetical protein
MSVVGAISEKNGPENWVGAEVGAPETGLAKLTCGIPSGYVPTSPNGGVKAKL